MTPAVFLDRDGTLMEEVHYCRDPALVRLLPGVREGLARLADSGFQLVIVTNQSGLGRGLITMPEYQAVQARLLNLLAPTSIAATYFCADAPEHATDRRKPGPGMLLEAARDLTLRLPDSWLIGDKLSDVQCAKAAGVRPILVQTGYGREATAPPGALIASDFATAAELILRGK